MSLQKFFKAVSSRLLCSSVSVTVTSAGTAFYFHIGSNICAPAPGPREYALSPRKSEVGQSGSL